MSAGASVRCGTCGAGLVAGAAFCERCGATTAEPSGHDRPEINLGHAAAVSERGRIHLRNEDAFRIDVVGDATVAVVCDGVSTSVAADIASRRAADAAAGFVTAALRNEVSDVAGAIATAMSEAHAAVAALEASREPELSDPASTLVCAVSRGPVAFVGWAGDSRAYWLGSREVRQLTTDNAWGAEQVAAGNLSPAEVEADPRSRSITRWVGADAPDDPPQLVTVDTAKPGLLILCSDGLWSYVPQAEEVAHTVRRLPHGSSALAVARGLTELAVERGGHDDITVAVIDLRVRGGIRA